VQHTQTTATRSGKEATRLQPIQEASSSAIEFGAVGISGVCHSWSSKVTSRDTAEPAIQVLIMYCGRPSSDAFYQSCSVFESSWCMKFHRMKVSYLHTHAASCFILFSYLNFIRMSFQMTSSTYFPVLVETSDSCNYSSVTRHCRVDWLCTEWSRLRANLWRFI
jgi:hypothetical protein